MKPEHLEEIKLAVSSSLSFKEAAQKLGGMNMRTLMSMVKRYGTDTSHFTRIIERGDEGKEKKLERILNNETPCFSHKLKMILFAKGLKAKRCEDCSITDWKGLPAPLELHHVDGNKVNNRLDNLRILCPNCHAQTTSYKGKNIKSAPLSPEGRVALISAVNSSKTIKEAVDKANLGLSPRMGYFFAKQITSSGEGSLLPRVPKAPVKCKRLSEIFPESPTDNPVVEKPRVEKRPPIDADLLRTQIWEKSALQLAKEIGFSTAWIKNACKKHGIETPPRGYWTRRYAGMTHEESLVSKVRPDRVKKILREDAEKAANLVMRGESKRAAAKAIGVHYTSLTYVWKRFGITVVQPTIRASEKPVV